MLAPMLDLQGFGCTARCVLGAPLIGGLLACSAGDARVPTGSSGTGSVSGSGGTAGVAAGGSAGSFAGGGGASGAGGGVGSGGGNASGGMASHGGAGGVAPADAGLRWSSEPIASPPLYSGTLNNGAGCSQQYRTVGFQPVDASGGKHPLFLYFVGTTFVAGDQSSQYDCQAAKKVTEAMARRGFVALSVEYDNGALAWLSDHVSQLACLFGAANSMSVLAVACGLPQVDCNLGIATWGHSQGALVADLAANSDARVRAVWATGYGGDARATLPRSRFRLVNAEGDTGNAVVASLDQTAGFTTVECPDDGRKQCLRNDGSGWIIVEKKDCQLTSADHCWFDKLSCTDTPETLEPNWIDPASTKPFALEPNADWVAETVRRP
jgi:hypothetical protein